MVSPIGPDRRASAGRIEAVVVPDAFVRLYFVFSLAFVAFVEAFHVSSVDLGVFSLRLSTEP